MNDKKVAIHYCSDMSPWIEFYTIVDAKDRVAAEAAARRAVNAYWENEDLCYGDVLENELKAAGLEHQTMLCDYDIENDEPTERWLGDSEWLHWAMPVVNIFGYEEGYEC